MKTPALEVQGICKSFPGVKALQNVSFSCDAGKVYALVGENGAGKSTLLKILFGVLQSDEGRVLMHGKEVQFHSPLEAEKAGIGMVFQELSLFQDMTIAQNIWLNREPTDAAGLIRQRKRMEDTQTLLETYHLRLDAGTIVRELSAAEKQMVEIVKILNRSPDILFLDEATSSLSGAEVEELFSLVRELKQHGKTIIFISHRMHEIFEIADELLVMKDGCYVGGGHVCDMTEDQIVDMMVGRSLSSTFPPKGAPTQEAVFEVEKLCSDYGFHDISFSVRRGEVLGVAGLQGHGQTELMCTLAGVMPHRSGEIRVQGSKVTFHNPKQAIRQGITLVPEDRKIAGLCLTHTIRNNIALASLRLRLRGGLIDRRAEGGLVNDMIEKLRIKTPDAYQTANNLSGGNQQKVVLAKCLAIHPKCLLFDEPTRGIDVAAKQEFYKIIRQLADSGIAVLVYSSDLIEVMGICDRILVMYEKQIVDTIGQERMTEEEIMHSAMGLRQQKRGESA